MKSATSPWNEFRVIDKPSSRPRLVDASTNRRRDIDTRTACALVLNRLKRDQITGPQATEEIIALGLSEEIADSIVQRIAGSLAA